MWNAIWVSFEGTILSPPVVPQLSLDRFPPKGQDCLFDLAGHPEGLLLADPASEPVTEAKVFIDQVASHVSSLYFYSGNGA